jgi:hypothetical protein
MTILSVLLALLLSGSTADGAVSDPGDVTRSIVSGIAERGMEGIPERFDFDSLVAELSKVVPTDLPTEVIKTKLRARIDLFRCGGFSLTAREKPADVRQVKTSWFVDYRAKVRGKNATLRLMVRGGAESGKIFNVAVPEVDFNLLAATKTQLRSCAAKHGGKACWDALLREKGCS